MVQQKGYGLWYRIRKKKKTRAAQLRTVKCNLQQLNLQVHRGQNRLLEIIEITLTTDHKQGLTC